MGELIYSQYVGIILQMDKAKYEAIQADPSLQSLTPEEKLKSFSPEFQSSVRSLFEAYENHQSATQRLAKSVFGIISVSGATLDEASKLIETAFNRGISRSYMSKLFRIGELLTAKPELSAVKDVEKLAEISRIPESRRDAALQSLNVASATRDQVKDLVNQEMGAEKPEASKQSTPSKQVYVQMIRKIEAMAHDLAGDAELAMLFERCVATLNVRVAALEQTKIKSA